MTESSLAIDCKINILQCAILGVDSEIDNGLYYREIRCAISGRFCAPA